MSRGKGKCERCGHAKSAHPENLHCKANTKRGRQCHCLSYIDPLRPAEVINIKGS